MKAEGRSTIIMTTHDRDQANRVGDFQLAIKNGRIESQYL
jgi:ABC-type proline/glycine betaine transport system ATPase subunit